MQCDTRQHAATHHYTCAGMVLPRNDVLEVLQLGNTLQRTWDPSSQAILPSLRTFRTWHYVAERTSDPTTTEPPGHNLKILVVNAVVVGLFEEGKEGTGITSHVVKVKEGDPAHFSRKKFYLSAHFWGKINLDGALFVTQKTWRSIAGKKKSWRRSLQGDGLTAQFCRTIFLKSHCVS